ncbi:MAG: phosphatidylglycerol lysyltransferase domain-containing protein [Pseudomonadota bacterium]
MSARVPGFDSAYNALKARLERRAISAPDYEVPNDLRWQHLRAYGDFPLAYPLVAERYLRSFGDQRGAIAYAQELGVTFALGDPICAPEHRCALLDDFVATFRAPVFVAAQAHTAEYLSQKGYQINHLGHDSVIYLPGHSFAGKTYKRVRYGTNWLTSLGGRIVENTEASVSAKDIKRLSESWLQSRVTPQEVRFLSRRFSSKPEPDVRRFFALSENDDVIGISSFDPIYRDGSIIGYLASQKRRQAEGTAYLDLAMMRHAIDVFQAEGREAVYLGLSPMADVEPTGFPRESRWVRSALQRAHSSNWVNTRIYNSRGILEYKMRLRGRRIPLYVCMPDRGSGILRMVALAILLRVV